jgi:hypothetical protein
VSEETLHVITRDETSWLQKQRNRYRRMSVYCVVFAVLLTIVTAITHFVVFGVVAAYFCFFSWNRWHEWRRAEHWLKDPARVDKQKRATWLVGFARESNQPPLWERVSNWIAGITAIAVVGIQFTIAILTGGLWIRIFYGFVCGLLGLAFLAWLWMRRRARLGGRSGDTMPEPWDELT